MSEPDEVRTRIIELAVGFDGSHYLWGAAGATPDGQEGCRMRPNSVTLAPASLDPNSPAVFAAQCSIDGRNVCAGRYSSIDGGRPANPSDQDLQDYLAGLDPNDPSSWNPYYEYFSPRLAIEKGHAPYLVWGEDCRNKYHFDCVGLVNYCYDTALAELVGRWANRPWQLSIAQYLNANSGFADVSDGELKAGDVLTIGNHHIGLYVGDGDGSSENPGTVVQAEQTSVGVRTGAYNSASWTARRRMADAYLS